MRRALINTGAHIITAGHDGANGVDALLDRTGRLISEIAARYRGHAGPVASRFQTARELTREAPAATPWRAPPYLADGAITELDGKIKLAGKTTLALAMVRAILDGTPFMGRPTVQSPVVYLTEQPITSFVTALHAARVRDGAAAPPAAALLGMTIAAGDRVTVQVGLVPRSRAHGGRPTIWCVGGGRVVQGVSPWRKGRVPAEGTTARPPGDGLRTLAPRGADGR